VWIPKREDERIFFSNKLLYPRGIQNSIRWNWCPWNQSQLIESGQKASQIIRIERNRNIQVESHPLHPVQHSGNSSGNNKIDSTIL